MSLRLLLLLSAGGSKTADMLALADTIVIYGAEFGVADENLHGGVNYFLDEFDTRRELVKEATRQLVRKGLVRVTPEHDGFRFSIAPQGKAFSDNLESDYAVEYRQLTAAVNSFIGDKTENEIFNIMSEIAEKGRGHD